MFAPASAFVCLLAPVRQAVEQRRKFSQEFAHLTSPHGTQETLDCKPAQVVPATRGRKPRDLTGTEWCGWRSLRRRGERTHSAGWRRGSEPSSCLRRSRSQPTPRMSGRNLSPTEFGCRPKRVGLGEVRAFQDDLVKKGPFCPPLKQTCSVLSLFYGAKLGST